MTHVPLVRAVFGEGAGWRVMRPEETAAAVDERLMPGQLAFITGPSGAGKSTILGCLRRRLRGRGAVVVDPALLPDRPVVDCIGAGFDMTLNLLAMCGLSDGPLLGRCATELSAGQRWRLALAVGLHRVRRRGMGTLLVDEFASSVDRVSALCLCRTVRRFVMSRSIRAVCVSHDEGLMEALGPALLVVQPLHAAALVRQGVGCGGS